MAEMGRIKKTRGDGTTGIRDTCIMDLPNDSLLQIFSRLPIKAVMICKFVCTDWKEFILQPDFAHNYVKKPPFTTRLMPALHHLFDHKQAFRLLEISSEGDAIGTRIVPELPRVPDWVISGQSYAGFIGSSIGLLCHVVLQSGEGCVYNLITEERIGLQETKRDSACWEYKFGYCPFMDKFKLLRFDCFTDSNEEVNCEILTIGVDFSWRYLVTPFRDGLCLNEGVVVNGVVHWIVKDGDSEWICTFEFGEEKFDKISHPSGLVLNSWSMRLSDYNNQLCLIDESDRSKVCIWVMKQYGVAESWVNYMALRSWFPIPSHYFLPQSFIPLAILPDGDMVFPHAGSESTLVYCNLKQRRCSITEVFDDATVIKVPLRMLQAFARIDV